MALAFVFSNLAGTVCFLKGREIPRGIRGYLFGREVSDGMHGWDLAFILWRLNESQVV